MTLRRCFVFRVSCFVLTRDARMMPPYKSSQTRDLTKDAYIAAYVEDKLSLNLLDVQNDRVQGQYRVERLARQLRGGEDFPCLGQLNGLYSSLRCHPPARRIRASIAASSSVVLIPLRLHRILRGSRCDPLPSVARYLIYTAE
jgi:hypothetical protein